MKQPTQLDAFVVASALLLGACVFDVAATGDEPPATAPHAAPVALPQVTVAELERLLLSPQRPTLIDVRAARDYEAFHIPGAIRRAPHELAYSAALRAGDPIIVAEGHGVGRVFALLADHPGARSLAGGMAAWCAAGGATIGACVDADVIAPERLFEASACADRELLFALTPDAGSLADRAGAAIARSSGRPVMVADGDGSAIATLRAALPDSIKGYVFFVRGGLVGYAAFIARQQALAHRTTLVSLGADTPEQRAFVISKKDCGCL